MDTWLIISTFILISQVESQLVIEQSPKNATVSVGESVIDLTCVFSLPVDCNWIKDDQPYRIKPADGNTYTGESSTGENTRDCSIRISALTQDDFAQWRCSTYGSKGVSAVSTEAAWITKRVAPTPPVILFNNKKVSEIRVTSTEPARENMVCVCERGNPAADLSWEVNGTPYLGRLERVEVGPNLYTVQLFWDRGGGWQIFDNSTEVICKAKHPGFTKTMTARVEFKRNFAPTTVKVRAEGFDDRDVAIRRCESVLLACISEGHPRPTYTWELRSEEDQTRKLYNNCHNEQNITVTIGQLGKYTCKTSNDLNKYTPTTSLNQLTVSEPVETTSAFGFSAIVAIGLGVTLVITIIISTTCVIQLRRKLRSITQASPCPLPTLGQLNAGANETTASNPDVTSPVSRGLAAPSTRAREVQVLYEDIVSNVRRENTDSNGYLVPVHVYAEIKDQSPRMKGEDDKGYVALL